MSIIADTLKHLQARSTTTTPEMADEPGLRPTFNQGEGAGRHRKDARIKFWITGISITLGLGGLALSTFWVGWNLDFGFSTNTHARVADSRLEPTPPLSSEFQETPPRPSETIVVARPDPVQSPQPHEPQTNIEHNPQVSIAAIASSPTQGTSSKQTAVESQLVASPPEPPVLSQSLHQEELLVSVDTAPRDRNQIALRESSTQETITPLTAMDRVAPQEDHLPTEAILAEERHEPDEAKTLAVPLKEELVHTEEFYKTAKLSTSPTNTTQKFSALKEKSRPTDLNGVPRQQSPANRLSHAQQLIRSGEYKDAVTLLSPLFHDPPVKWQPWFWMGTALLGQGDVEQADQFFLSGLARNDKVPQLWIQRALVAQQRGDYQLAIHELRQAESLEADIPHIHLNMGFAYERLGNARLANQYYEKFLKLSEDQPAFFSTRKKLFARFTRQTPTKTPSPPFSPTP